MRLSLEWLKQWVNIDLSPEELSALLTFLGLEIDAIHFLPESDFDKQDVLLDIAITPNRGDCLSVQGVAREISAKTNTQLNPVYDFKKMTERDATQIIPHLVFPVSIHPSAQMLCPLYLGRVIQDINIQAETPHWLKSRLAKSEMNSISPVVDILNYVLIELGQPMHAFDLAKIDSEIQVRLADNQEKLKLLNDKDITLKNNTVVIADKNQPIALAGIMGGLNSAVGVNTTQIFLESAWFIPEAIAGKMREYGLHTDAAYRFERGVDYQLPHQAMILATNLILSICGGKPGKVITQKTPALPTKLVMINLRLEKITQVLGIALAPILIEQILTRLGCTCVGLNKVEDNDKVPHEWQVTIPSYRYDLRLEVDLIEEIARIYGYENIPAQPSLTTQIVEKIESGLTLHRVKQHLVSLGYREVITYSFVAPKLNLLCNSDIKPIHLANPISQDMSVMRTSLLPGLIQTLQFNLARQVSNLAIFESGLCFYYQGEELIQENKIAGLLYGKRYEENWADPKLAVDFFDMKAHIESMIKLKNGDLQKLEWARSTHPSFHPGQSAEVRQENNILGWFGALAPGLLAKIDITEPVYYFELKLKELLATQQMIYHKFSAFPSTRRDLAFILSEDISAQAIQAVLTEVRQANTGFILQESFIFDVYRGKNIENGKKSLAVGMIFQHPTRTLVESEVEAVIMTIIEKLKNKFGIVLRD